jgi:hypothetical protein
MQGSKSGNSSVQRGRRLRVSGEGSEAAELGTAAESVCDPAGGAEAAVDAHEDQPRAVDTEDGGAELLADRFGQLYYAKSGLYGPAYYFNAAGTGNKWTMNIWDTTGQTVPTP